MSSLRAWACECKPPALGGVQVLGTTVVGGAGDMLSLGPSSCVSLWWLSEEFLFRFCSRCSHLGISAFLPVALYLAVTCSVSRCCMWFVVLFFWRFCAYSGRNAWLDSGYLFCISVWLSGSYVLGVSGCCVWSTENWILREIYVREQCLARPWIHVLHQYGTLSDTGAR